jgi:hypothetical protein
MQKPIKCLTHFFLEVFGKLDMPADTCVGPDEYSSGPVNCLNQIYSVVLSCMVPTHKRIGIWPVFIRLNYLVT